MAQFAAYLAWLSHIGSTNSTPTSNAGSNTDIQMWRMPMKLVASSSNKLTHLLAKKLGFPHININTITTWFKASNSFQPFNVSYNRPSLLQKHPCFPTSLTDLMHSRNY
jgi:hypothetical protein